MEQKPIPRKPEQKQVDTNTSNEYSIDDFLNAHFPDLVEPEPEAPLADENELDSASEHFWIDDPNAPSEITPASQPTSKEGFKSGVERVGRISKRTLKLMGGTALVTVSPFIQEYIDYGSVNRARRQQYRKDRPKTHLDDRLEQTTALFKGSVEDIKKSNRERRERLQREKDIRRKHRREFFE